MLTGKDGPGIHGALLPLVFSLITASFASQSVLVVANDGARNESEICKLCNQRQSNFTAQMLRQFCHDNKSMLIDGRCCLTERGRVLGVDLSNCSLHNTSNLFTGRDSLKWIALTENKHIRVDSDDFTGLSDLMTIYLPTSISCPGGDGIWNRTEVLKNENVKLCYNQLDSCTKLNVTCPDNSHCESNGPGYHLCLCNSGWHGYRCLNYGTFPYAQWLGGISAGFFGVTFLLWCAQKKSIANLRRQRLDSDAGDGAYS